MDGRRFDARREAKPLGASRNLSATSPVIHRKAFSSSRTSSEREIALRASEAERIEGAAGGRARFNSQSKNLKIWGLDAEPVGLLPLSGKLTLAMEALEFLDPGFLMA